MKKILIVSSHKLSILKEHDILSRKEFKILTAASGDEALNMHKAEKMDLIITDIDLPGMSGDELCAAIRGDDKLKKVSLIIVCQNRSSDFERSSVCGANSCVTKPINSSEFVEKVCDLLDIRERRSHRVLIKVEVKGKAINTPFFCSSHNLSASGMLLETDRPLAKGDRISCSFFLPDSNRIVAEGEIVRVERKTVHVFRFGVKFINIDQESISAIEAFIRSCRAA